jgi:hypothetical protein
MDGQCVVYTPRQGESEVYQELWNIAVSGSNNNQDRNDDDDDDDDLLGGGKAVEFFKKSGLDMGTLKAIWTWCSPDPVMNKEQFFAALRYIAISQNGENLSKGNSLVLQRFIYIILMKLIVVNVL